MGADMKVFGLIWVPIWNYRCNIFIFRYDHLNNIQWKAPEAKTISKASPTSKRLSIHAWTVSTHQYIATKQYRYIGQKPLALIHSTAWSESTCKIWDFDTPCRWIRSWYEDSALICSYQHSSRHVNKTAD